ncbi:unnamed protein product [Owenia fusiformis]|uniref:Uncharacterized protein n=1 Tax=Owenia fusiformis TaxID=6347 RepID=A0A8J1UWV9_OWEFU|nr:unnamed protein product [Owenia fusiformis]
MGKIVHSIKNKNFYAPSNNVAQSNCYSNAQLLILSNIAVYPVGSHESPMGIALLSCKIKCFNGLSNLEVQSNLNSSYYSNLLYNKEMAYKVKDPEDVCFKN